MFAVVRTGGKQYRVAAGDKIVVEKMGGEAGETVRLSDVLLAGEGSELRNVEGLLVQAEIIAQAKADKVIVFKKRRRHNYRRKNGHRQQHTILRITAIGDEKAPPRAAKNDKQEAPVTEAPQVSEDAVIMDAAPIEAAPRARAKKAVPQQADMEPAATEPQVQEPLKVEGAESALTDTPAKAKKTKTDKTQTDTTKAD